MQNIIQTIGRLNKIALPLIFTNLVGVATVLADQAIIGRISTEAFNAVGAAGALFSLVAGIVGYISVQFTITGGKAFVNDKSDFDDEFSSAIVLNVILGLAFFAFFIVLNRPIFSIIYGFDGTTLEMAVSYANIMSIYMLLQLLMFNFGAFFKIKQNTKWIMIVSAIAGFVNLALDFVFILGLGFGVRMAAVSNVIGLAVGVGLYAYLCRHEIKIISARRKIYKQKMGNVIKNSLPLMGQEILEGGVFAVVIMSVIARLGDYQLSAYIILTHIIGFALLPVYMYGTAILTLVSQAKEARDFTILPKAGLFISSVIYVVLGILLFIFRGFLPAIITDNSDIIGIASSFMLLMVASNFFVASSVVYKYSLQAMGFSKFVLYQTAIVNILAIIALIVAIFAFDMQLHGVFAVLLLNYLALSVIYGVKYKKIVKEKD